MIVTADWVLPVSRPPIRNGAVAVRGRTILEVGTLAKVSSRYPEAVVCDHQGCVITPGLVNAHTHLSLNALAGLVPSMPFPAWLARIAEVSRALDEEDHIASATLGALQCLQSGATVVGDVCYGPEALSAAGDMGLGGTFFWEILGVDGDDLASALEHREFPDDPAACAGGRLRCGISPHTPYTSGPDLLHATYQLARKRNAGYMLHLAESAEESRLFARGDGPLAALAERLAHGFTTPRSGAVEYAHRLGVLNGAVAVHCVHLGTGEAQLLAEHARGVVLCPRSNRYLHNGTAPVADLHALGADMAIGTDSAASNEGVDLFAEARAVNALDHGLSASRLLRMLTLEGARVLGLDDLFGSLEPGKQADLAIVRIGPTDHPAERLIEVGASAVVRGVMSAGAWRILDGRPVVAPDTILAAAERVRQKAAHVLGGVTDAN